MGPFGADFGKVVFAAFAVGIVLSGLACASYRKCLPHLPVEAELEDHVAAVTGYTFFFGEKR